MSVTVGSGISLGGFLPPFTGLIRADGKAYSATDFDDDPALVLVFVGNGCPTVRRYEDRLTKLHRGRDGIAPRRRRRLGTRRALPTCGRSIDAGGLRPATRRHGVVPAAWPISRPRGAGGTVDETVVQLEPGTTLLVFTDDLASPPTRARAGGLRVVQAAAERGPRALEDLCDHLIASCVAPDGEACEDDASLVAVRLDN